MEWNINLLVGLSLEGCRFSKGSYSFEFCGNINGEFKSFSLGTSYNVSTSNYIDDLCEHFSSEIWGFLEEKLISVVFESNGRAEKIIFHFSNEDNFFIWAEIPVDDNLLIVTDMKTGEWFPIG